MKLLTLPKNNIFNRMNPLKILSLPRNARSEKVNLERVYGMCRRKRQGAAAVEFAIVAPLFFLLVLGMIEIGRMVMVQQIITNASREGARIAILDGTTGQEVKDKVKSYTAPANIILHDTDITVNPTEPTAAKYGEPVTVTVSIEASRIQWIPRPRFAESNKKLEASTVMRRETVQ
jgi:Flp pilus assembly protein TadG